ncbi:MAG: 1-acyl-sn-glycerol-3-phosphate acyltransferase [Firmicutes bacterium]|nr:1-acyl-sn-glycerol-3-phosphate acyltransferase [Bacillota bacterium]
MLYAILRQILRWFFRLCCRWRVEGLENVPPQGPVVVVSNHVSWWDPVVVGCALNRPVHFMAKEELFQIPVFGSLLVRLNAFPVKRGQPDRQAIRHALQILEDGKILGLFPEGTRSKTGELQKPHPGAAMIALKARAPIVPVACIETQRLFAKGWFHPFTVRIGKPLVYSDYFEQKLTTKTLEVVSQEIMDEIGALFAGFDQIIAK